MTEISISHLSKAFGRIQAVDDLSFTVPPGVVTGFVGPNGAGKTSTLRMLLGLVRPDHGQALVGAQRYQDLAAPVCTVGAVLEATAFYPGHSARVHLTAGCKAAGVAETRVAAVLDEVGLTDVADRRAGTFSLGMRQRLALATALLGEPGVLVLDEPANGLDPEGVHWLRTFLRAQADGGCTVLVSSHALAEIEQIADRLVVINNGRLLAEGGLEELVGVGAGLEDAYLDLVRGTR